MDMLQQWVGEVPARILVGALLALIPAFLVWALVPVWLVRLRSLATEAEEVELESSYRSAIGQVVLVVAGIPAFVAAVSAFHERTQADYQGQYRYAFQALNNQSSLPSRLGGVLSLRELAEKSPANAPVIYEALALAATKASEAERREGADIIGPEALFTLRRVVDRRYVCGDPEFRKAPGDTCASEGSKSRSECRHSSEYVVKSLCDELGISLRLRNGFFKGADAQKAELNGADLAHADLSGSNLRYAQLYEANLLGANFNAAHLVGAQMIWTNIAGATFCRGQNFVDKQLIREGTVSAQMADVILRAAQALTEPVWFHGAFLQDASFHDAQLPYARFDEAWAPNAHFDGADLTGVSFMRANLEGATFSGANLTDADLTEAKIERTQLRDATLCRTILGKDEVANKDCQDKPKWPRPELRPKESCPIPTPMKVAQ